jgi:hypothetical protein
MHCTHLPLFDYLVGGREQRSWHGKTESLGSVEVDRKLVFRRLLEWQIAGFFSAQNAIDVGRSTAK